MIVTMAPPQCGTCGTLLASHGAPCRVCALEWQVKSLSARMDAVAEALRAAHDALSIIADHRTRS